MHRFFHALSFFSLGFVAAATHLPAQSNASVETDINTKVVSGVSLAKTQDLQFGAVVRSVDGGRVTIDPNSDEISYDGVTRGQSTTFRAAAFQSTGEPDYSYSISLPRIVTLTRKHGTQTLNVRDFHCTNQAGRLDSRGADGFKVGATLEVGANQETGQYSGSFTVMVEYQ